MENETDIILKKIELFINELNSRNIYKLVPEGDPCSDNYEYNIYNEISLQHELGHFLKDTLNNEYNVFFEKNMYDEDKEDWVKKEVDLIIVNKKNDKEKYALELKFSKGKNARTPENMYDFIKDIRFMEQVIEKKGFTNAYNFILVDSRKYYNMKLNKKNKNDLKRYNIYKIFRRKDENIILNKTVNKDFIIKKDEMGQINNYYCHPTGKEPGKIFKLSKKYNLKWEKLLKSNIKKDDKYEYKYLLIPQIKF